MKEIFINGIDETITGQGEPESMKEFLPEQELDRSNDRCLNRSWIDERSLYN